MCGIAGILGSIAPEDDGRVAKMNEAQVHRGPDAGRVKKYPGAMLGHRRLSIIDLSDRALQPMETPDGRFSVVFNGEIYNYKELRDQLKADHAFRSDSDTEVLLASWVKWGEDCLERFNGMFAFCIYNTLDGSAFLARDRFGQKPLFFSTQPKRFIFSSEVKALLVAGVPARPNLNAWARYLVSASYDDEDDSFFEGISQLRPGECATWSLAKGLSRRTYYDLADHIPKEPRDIGIEEATGGVRRLLVDSARLHMRSDVPVGIALSGGLDSSSLLACLNLASQLNKGVHCFSFDFGSDFSERQWMKAAAGHYGLSSNIQTMTPQEFRDSIKPLMWHLEGPIGGLANCAFVKVMEAARAQGVKVLQDGTGLDEAFAGYRNHHNLYVGLMLERGEKEALQAIRDYARIWEVDESAARQMGQRELSRSRAHQQTAIDGTLPTRSELLSADFVTAHPGFAKPVRSVTDPLRDALIDYLQVRKVTRNTRMKDRVSMAYSIEQRLPFLDHRLIEYALSLPPSYYFLLGRTKSIVREALKGAMDETVRTASKRSILTPQGKWLREEPMRSYIGDLITSTSFHGRGIFDTRKVKRIFDSFCKVGMDNSFFVWQWINLEEWFRTFVDQPLKMPVHNTFAAHSPMTLQ